MPKRRELHGERALYKELSLWMNTRLCMHRVTFHKTTPKKNCCRKANSWELWAEKFLGLIHDWDLFKFLSARVERPCCGRLYFPKMIQCLPYHILFYSVTCYSHIGKWSLIFLSFSPLIWEISWLFLPTEQVGDAVLTLRLGWRVYVASRLPWQLPHFPQLILLATWWGSYDQLIEEEEAKFGSQMGQATSGPVLHYSLSRGSCQKQWWRGNHNRQSFHAPVPLL